MDWSAITGKPAAFPPAPHSHPAEEIEAGGVANEWTYLRGDGQWAPPRNGAVITGGILRIYPDGVEIHTNNSHGNTGIRGFGEDADGKNIWDESGRLIVKHVAAGGVIVYIGASPDETLVKNGITAGCSGGVGTTIVQFAQYGQPLDMRLPEDYAKVAGNYSNLWITWVHQATGGA